MLPLYLFLVNFRLSVIGFKNLVLVENEVIRKKN